MRDFKVLCCWDASFMPHALDGIRQVAEVEVRPPDREFLLANAHRYDAYLATLFFRFDREIIARAKRMKFIATPSTGLDHIDREALDAAGIELLSITTDYAMLDRVTATAEMAWGLLLAAIRKIPAAHAAAMSGRWARDRFRGRQLSGKTLGVLGVGRLGRMVVEYGRAFRMNVIGCDPHPLRPVAGLEYVGFGEFLERSDAISIHVHLNDATRGLLDRPAFARMKDGVVLVNTSRGAIIDEDALLASLENGKVAAAGLDVIDGEWRDDLADHELIRYAREHENVVITPHLGGGTYESQEISHKFIADRLAERLRSLSAGGSRPEGGEA